MWLGNKESLLAFRNRSRIGVNWSKSGKLIVDVARSLEKGEDSMPDRVLALLSKKGTRIGVPEIAKKLNLFRSEGNKLR
jgi:hypothetical protein